MRITAAIAAIACLFLSTGAARAEIKSFKDWVAGCDNVLACTAIGLSAEDSADIAYIAVSRAAGPGAAPTASLVVLAQVQEGPARMTLTLDGRRFGEVLEATSDGAYARTTLDGRASAVLIAALVNAKGLTVSVDGAAPVAVSMTGSSASLRYMDAMQKRDGGVTALVAKGAKPASDVPPAPAAPRIDARPLTALDALPARPRGLPKPDSEMCNGQPDGDLTMAFDLGGGATLWGVCSTAGAYNYAYDFYVARPGAAAAPVAFALPGEAPDGTLINPWVSEDGATLQAFNKGRGLGDCGDEQSWAWDGTAMRLAGYRSMPECRGVSPDDWIRLHTAVTPAGNAAAGSCNDTIGKAAADKLVAQCLEVSPAIRPPCNGANACAMIADEIKRGCALIDSADRPAFCAEPD